MHNHILARGNNPFALLLFTSALGGTYTVSDGRDHQYDPYGGVDHADLKGGESWYLSAEAFSDPENWGYSFPLEITYVDQNGFVYKSVVRTQASQIVRIKSMGRTTNHLSDVKKVSLLGFNGKLKWRQTDDALEIVYPPKAKLKLAVVFRIESAVQ